MKKTLHVFLLFFAVLAYGQTAEATLPAYDGFDYAVGTNLITTETEETFGGHPTDPAKGSFNGMVGIGKWNLNKVTMDPLTVKIAASPSWTAAGLTPPQGNALFLSGVGERPEFNFTKLDAGDIGYGSFLMKVSSVANVVASTDGTILAALSTITSSGTYSPTSAIHIRKSGEGYQLGASGGRGAAAGDVIQWLSTAHAVNDEVFIVLKYRTTEKRGSLFVNPVLNGTEPAIASPGSTSGVFDRFGAPGKLRFYQNGAELTPETIIDEVRIAKTWSQAVLSTPSNSAVAEIAVYPNPVSEGTLFINSKTNTSVEIYSVLGKKVLEASNVSESVDVSNLAKGCYILKLKDESNAVQTKKLIIQ